MKSMPPIRCGANSTRSAKQERWSRRSAWRRSPVKTWRSSLPMRFAPNPRAPLAQLVHEKTAGNPFFLIQFLYALAEEGLLVFDHEKALWSWDLNSIHAKGYTDNVVELMVGKLNRLPLETP